MKLSIIAAGLLILSCNMQASGQTKAKTQSSPKTKTGQTGAKKQTGVKKAGTTAQFFLIIIAPGNDDGQQKHRQPPMAIEGIYAVFADTKAMFV